MGDGSFEELIVWQESRGLAKRVYQIFLRCKDYGFRDQLQRAAVSVMNNIAEGHGRRSKAEWRQYLYISRGSISEVRSMLYLAKDLKLITEEEYEELHSKSLTIARMLTRLIQSIYRT